MQPMQSPARELDDEISVSRRLRRMKRRLLLDASDLLADTPPSTPTTSKAVRTAVNPNHRYGLYESPSLSLEAPITPRSITTDDDGDFSKDLSIRSDPGPAGTFFRNTNSNVSGVRKLRRIKRRLFLEQLNASSPTSTRSVSELAAISPFKNPSFVHKNGGASTVGDMQASLKSASDIVANDDHNVDMDMRDTVSPLLSPRLSATRLRRIKRRLFLDHLEGLDFPNDDGTDDAGMVSNIMDIDNDDHGEILEKASSKSLMHPQVSPFMRIDSWSDKVEHDRAALLKEPPQLRMPPVGYPAFPDLKKRDPQQGKSLGGLPSKLELLSLKEALKSTYVGSPKKHVIPDPSSNAAIFI